MVVVACVINAAMSAVNCWPLLIVVACASALAGAATNTLLLRHRFWRRQHRVAATSDVGAHTTRGMLSELRSEVHRWQAIAVAAPVALLTVDRGGRIRMANPSAARLLHREVDALIGSVISDVIASDALGLHLDAHASLRVDAAAVGAPFRTRLRVFGQPSRSVEVHLSALGTADDPVWLLALHDQSELQDIRSTLTAAQEQSLGAKRATAVFLERLSRELRTPLHSMVGVVRLLRRSGSSQFSPRDQQYLDRVQAGSEHVLTLVSDLLDLSRLDAGDLTLTAAPVDVREIVDDVAAGFAEQIADRPITIDLVTPSSAAIAVVDAEALRQIVQNLMSNAVKYTARGSVTVSVQVHHATGAASAVVVRDTGIGIPLERQSAIFTAFGLTDVVPASDSGSGLGLALSRRLAQEMGCLLSVESTPGAGSTFTLAFGGVAVRAPAPAVHTSGLLHPV